MLTLTFLFKILIDFYIIVFLLQAWMYFFCCDLANSFSNFILVMTQPVLKVFFKCMPVIDSVEIASLFLTLILSIIKFPLFSFFDTGLFIFDCIYFLVGFLFLIKLIGIVLFWIVIFRFLLKWISNENNFIGILFFQLSEPIIQLFRWFNFEFFSVDFSILLLIFLLYVLNCFGMDLFPGIWYRL